MKTKNLMIALLLSGALFSVACEKSKKENVEVDKTEETEETAENVTQEEEPKTVGTIVEVAIGNENFSTLVTAVKAAGLVETLSSTGPFTVFAPVNDAFAKLPEGTVTSLLEPESKDKLTSILTYHVFSGKFMAADVVKAIGDNDGKFSIPTVQGGTITASLSDGNVILTDENGNASTIIMTDVAASNGVIHAINTVVMPK